MKAKGIKPLITSSSGIALPIAVMVIAVICILGFTAAFLVNSQAFSVSTYRLQEAAFHYAEAGINDYIWQMNQNPYFYIDTKDISKDYEEGRYVVKFIKVQTDSEGKNLVTIRSTGWARDNPGIRATIEAKLKLRSFSEYMIFTNYEGTQPIPTPKDYSDSEYDDLRSTWTMWKTGEVANGPIHTNDTFHIMAIDPGTGPTFNGKVTYSNHLTEYDSSKVIPPTLYCKKHNSYNDGHIKPTYNAGTPTWVPKMDLPASNKSLKELAQKDGLYLQGRTCIYLDGKNIIYTNHTDPTKKADSPRTLTPSDPLYPKNGVIYVDTLGGTSKWDTTRGNVFISGKLSGRLTVAAANDIYITAGNPTDYNNPPRDKYNDKNNEYGIFYNDRNGRDMLGLVANENIYILHTGWPTTTGNRGDLPANPTPGTVINKDNLWFVAPYNLHIDAVLFAVTGSFSLEHFNDVEDYNLPSLSVDPDFGQFSKSKMA